MAKSLDHLLGGYATNTLTDEEKRQLSEAALKDQALFDALADEEALKALLADPEARRRILASLESSAHPDESSFKGTRRWRWFRQQSSLAWAGSIAAMGLALIFGWQMEKEWGPMVQREQEAAKTASRDQMAFRQKETAEESRVPTQKEQMGSQRTQVEDVEAGNAVAPASVPPSPRVDAPKVDRLRQVPATAKNENGTPDRIPEARRQASNEKVAQLSASSSVPNQRLSNPSNIPLPVSPVTEPARSESVLREIAPAKLSAKVAEEDVFQPSTERESAQELFYAASGFLADEVMEEEKGKQKADQNLGGALSKAFKSSPDGKAFSPTMQRELAGEDAASSPKGIRYSFVQHAQEGKDEEVDSREISGNWKDIRLAVESNVSGYLYVLAPLGNGKWQKLVPINPGRTGKFRDSVQVKAFQRVEFSLGQVTNALGKLIVSSFRVLLSPNPLDDLDQWLGSAIDDSKLLIEQADSAVFVVQSGSRGNSLLRVDVPLAE